MADPVAAKSTFLCMYMSNHPDTLVAYVRHFGKVKEVVSSARMASIDSNGMALEYVLKGDGPKDANRSVRVEFDPPLSGYEEVKPRLLGMTADAQESLGMTKRPQINSFHLPRQAIMTVIPMIALFYVTASTYYPASNTLFAPGRYTHRAVGDIALQWIWGITITLHSLEALYTIALCRRHRTPFIVGFQYVFATFLCGFPIFTDLRKRIQKARIDSIMKVN
ncbi:hypothetical protein BD410DRAFT_795783 [Rickenella mellea]|uniref:DUF2470 domain-containing protein n=1 Tax=Rickenella mellea TaxID=50990 RepID=A0A4Y7PKR5_9AGAM|nr:hypothetical protein BD410DRAFT_795783 [Rickenella mellea]